jgi:hypothetical protein
MTGRAPAHLGTHARPDFLVIGAYKSGTTTLHHTLRAHPELFVPERKEPNFFAFADEHPGRRPIPHDAVRDLGTYLALFADARPGQVRGEVSPEYLANDAACANISRHVPDVKLVAILRDPAERAYSDFLMYARDGLEPHTDFGRALDEQAARARRGSPTGFYVQTGFYGAQLAPYFARFRPDRVHVVIFEQMVRDRPTTLAQLFAFLGVDPGFVPPDDRAYNVSGVPADAATRGVMRLRRRAAPLLRPLVPARAKHAVDRRLQRRLVRPQMPERERDRLVEVYRDDIEQLEGLLGRSVPEWRR